jgi:hypothetical protein
MKQAIMIFVFLTMSIFGFTQEMDGKFEADRIEIELKTNDNKLHGDFMYTGKKYSISGKSKNNVFHCDVLNEKNSLVAHVSLEMIDGKLNLTTSNVNHIGLPKTATLSRKD